MAEQIQYTPKHWSWTNPMSPLEDAFKLFIEDKRQKQQLSIQSRANELKAVETGLMSVAINSTLNANNLTSIQYKNDLDAENVESEITKLTKIKKDSILPDLVAKSEYAILNKSGFDVNGGTIKPASIFPISEKYTYRVDEDDPLTVKYWKKGQEQDENAWFTSIKIDPNGKYITTRNSSKYNQEFYDNLPANDVDNIIVKTPIIINDGINNMINSLTEKKKQIETAGNTNIANTARISNEAMDLWLETLRKQINGGWQ